MSLSEGVLTVTAVPSTKYALTEILGTTVYTVVSAATTKYIVSSTLQGLFLGKQNAVESGYVENGYFAGAEII